jgi:peptide/nickel transport system permease protein
MNPDAALATAPDTVAARALRGGEGPFALAWRRFLRHRLAVVALVVLALIAVPTAAAPLVVPESAGNRVDPRAMRAPPSAAHPFGTDQVGRDILVRTIYGGRISLAIGALSVAIAMSLGVLIGLVSGYYGGLVDNLLMRFTDAMLAIPTLFLLILVTRLLGPTVPTIILVIGLLSWMQVARIVRANILSLKEQEMVTAARTLGCDDRRIMLRHVLPNTLAPVIVAATLGVGHAIILEATASFLGLGVQPPTASWGNMLYRAQGLLTAAPWAAFFPGLMIMVTVLAVNFLGDGLRDALDPRMRR